MYAEIRSVATREQAVWRTCPLAVAQPCIDGVNTPFTNAEASPPHRIAGEGLSISIFRHAESGHAEFRSDSGSFRLIAPLSGSLAVIADEQGRQAFAGQGLLLPSMAAARCNWSAETSMLVIHARRSRVQAQASHALGRPCRLTGAMSLLPIPVGGPLATVLASLLVRVARPGDLQAPEITLLEQALAIAFVEISRCPRDPVDLFLIAGSIERAVDHLYAQPGRCCGLDDLAAASGVTLATLRRNFKSCLGMSMTDFIQQTRLDWVRERLACQTERRSIGQLAAASGFGNPGALSRGYHRRFAEAPSQTRERAFAMSSA